MDGDSDRSSSLWTDEAVTYSLFLTSEAAKLNPPSKIAFSVPVPSSVRNISEDSCTEEGMGLKKDIF